MKFSRGMESFSRVDRCGDESQDHISEVLQVVPFEAIDALMNNIASVPQCCPCETENSRALCCFI